MQKFILYWDDMGAKLGINRSVAQIYALLHIAPDLLSADEICELVNLARSNASTGLKELQSLGMVKLGDRYDHFTSIRDMFELVNTAIASRREREYLPTLQALEEVEREAEADAAPAAVMSRIKKSLDTFDGWYKDVSLLPRSVQMAALGLVGRIARFLSKSKDG